MVKLLVAAFCVKGAPSRVHTLSRVKGSSSHGLREVAPRANATFVNADAILGCRIRNDDGTNFATIEFLARVESSEKVWYV